jgi:hypothetical protein
VPKLARDRQLRVEIEQTKIPPRPKGELFKLLGAVTAIERLVFPLVYRITIESENDSTSTVLFNVRSSIAAASGISIRSIELWPRHGHPRAEDIRYPLDAYLQIIEHAIANNVFSPASYRIRNGVILGPDGKDIRTPTAKNPKPRERRRAQPLSENDMREIARVYRSNLRRPKKAVAEARGVSERTAARMIDQTRAAGFLGAALPNRPGEAVPAPPLERPGRR